MTGPLSTHLGLVGIEVGDIIGVTTCWGPSPSSYLYVLLVSLSPKRHLLICLKDESGHPCCGS